MGAKRIGGLKARVVYECCISRRGPDGPGLSSGSISAGGI